MRKVFAFLVWLFWIWQDFFLRWLWNPATSLASKKPLEHLPSQGGQEESEFARFLSSLPEDGRRCDYLSFSGDSPVQIYFGRFDFTFHHGTILKADYCEFLEAVASSKIVFHEEVHINLSGDDSCKHVEAFAEALRQSDNRFKKLSFGCYYGCVVRFAKCVSSVLLGNNAIQDLVLHFKGEHYKLEKEIVGEFVAIVGMSHNLQVLKSFDFNAKKLCGEGMEQLMKLFQGPSNVLEELQLWSLTSDAQFEHISEMLATNTSLKSLKLFLGTSARQKPFTCGYRSIAVALESNQSLDELSCDISSSMELKVLLDPLMPKSSNLQRNTTLRKLRLLHSIGGQKGIEILVDLIRTNTSLLELEFCKVDDLSLQDTNRIENVLAILEALKTNKSLKTISFYGCEAVGGYKVLGAMMDLLLENHSIEYIDLFGTGLEKIGDADYVSSALSKRRKMKLWSIVQNMAIVNPTSGRVFLCGEPFADKLYVLMFCK